MNQQPIVLRTRLVLPVSGRFGKSTCFHDGYVLCEQGKITEVGKFSRDVERKILDTFIDDLQIVGSNDESSGVESGIPRINGVALPGFVKSHGHDHESPIIGIAKEKSLTRWLDQAVNPYVGFLHDKEKELANSLGISPFLLTYLKARVDDLSFGITTSLVHHCNFNKYHVDELIEANRQAGTKLIIAIGSQDRNYAAEVLDNGPEQAIKRLDISHHRYGSEEMVQIIPGPDQFFSNGPEMLMALKKWARKHDTLIHIHSSEEFEMTQRFREMYGMTPVEYAHSLDFLDDKTFLAHQVHCTENDLNILQSTGAAVVHNPLANTILGSGMPPIVAMLKRKIPVVISTDGSGSADNQNMINAARVAAQYQKALLKDPTILPAQRVLEMITIDAARILGVNSGSLEPGKDADIIVVDLTRPNMTPTRRDNVVENLIWSAVGNEIRYVLANGQLVVDDYEFVKLNTEEILQGIQKLSEIFISYLETKEGRNGTTDRQ